VAVKIKMVEFGKMDNVDTPIAVSEDGISKRKNPMA
jgi:hypothetical protein